MPWLCPGQDRRVTAQLAAPDRATGAAGSGHGAGATQNAGRAAMLGMARRPREIGTGRQGHHRASQPRPGGTQAHSPPGRAEGLSPLPGAQPPPGEGQGQGERDPPQRCPRAPHTCFLLLLGRGGECPHRDRAAAGRERGRCPPSLLHRETQPDHPPQPGHAPSSLPSPGVLLPGYPEPQPRCPAQGDPSGVAWQEGRAVPVPSPVGVGEPRMCPRPWAARFTPSTTCTGLEVSQHPPSPAPLRHPGTGMGMGRGRGTIGEGSWQVPPARGPPST